MEEKCVNTQVDGRETLDSEEISPEELGDLCGGGCSHNSPNSVCMPICFLVREQAKSLIAIKDLQKRMHQVEGVQGDVISAISDVHDYLSVGDDQERFLQTSVSPRSCASNKSTPLQDKSPYLNVLSANLSASPLRSRLACSKLAFAAHISPSEQQDKKGNLSGKKSDVESDHHAQTLDPKFMGSIRAKDSAPESDKQDSGLDSDCREQGQESNPPQGEVPCFYNVCPPAVRNNSDELLDLLDEIGEKSEILRQHVSGLEESPNSGSEMCSEMTNLQLERLGLHNLLYDIKGERDDLKAKLDDLENTTDELAVEKKDLEQRFISALVEKHKLETRIHGMQPFSERRKSLSSSSSGVKEGYDVAYSELAKNLVYKVDGETVSSVLKETSTVDLQKQVLTYMMENEVLRIKLDQMGQLVSSKEMEKKCVEKLFREEVRQLMHENEQLRSGYEDQKIETETLLSRVNMLERVLQSMTIENRELNMQLAEFLYLREGLLKSKKKTVQQHSSSSSGSSPTAYSTRRLSLPAQHASEPDINVSCARSRLLPNTSSFIDVTIEDPDVSDRELAMTLEPFGISQRRSSTPLFSGKKHEKITFSDFPSSSFGLTTNSEASSCLAPERKPNKRLTFNSMKTLANSQNLGLSARDTYKPRFARNSSVTCDKVTKRTSDASASKPLESIRENIPDSKFPFYTILEKLKANSDYKLASRVAPPQPDGVESNVLSRCPASTKDESSSNSVPPKNPTDLPQEDNANHTKDKRGGAKNIHKRIQDILDRITAESDATSASAM